MKPSQAKAAELRLQIEAEENASKPTAEQWLLNFLSQPFKVIFTEGYISYFLKDRYIIQQDLKECILNFRYLKFADSLEGEYKINYIELHELIRLVVCPVLNCESFITEGCW